MSDLIAVDEPRQSPSPSVLYLIGRVDQGIRREMRARLVEWELTIQDFTTLALLKDKPGLSNAQLARRSLIAPQSMIQVLSALENRGLVRRDIGPGDARVMRARLTPAGRSVLDEADARIVAFRDQLLADLPPWQQEMLQQTLVDIMNKLSNGMTNPDAAPGGAAVKNMSR